MYTHAKDHMPTFGGLWKHQNNPAGTKSVSLHNAEVGHHTEEEASTTVVLHRDWLKSSSFIIIIIMSTRVTYATSSQPSNVTRRGFDQAHRATAHNLLLLVKDWALSGRCKMCI